jgi:hypothetical protein
MGDSLSQKKRILNMLHACWPGEVSALSLSKISLQYSARVYDLRRAGWTITNRVEIRNGTKYGFFRLGDPPIARSRELREQRAKTAEMPKQPEPTLLEMPARFDYPD